MEDFVEGHDATQRVASRLAAVDETWLLIWILGGGIVPDSLPNLERKVEEGASWLGGHVGLVLVGL